ncbi:RNA ligase [Pectobacterium phage vB_PcaM_CBB]|uniref:RNA ligase n=1 Tax=Pectobacterium phage vB_PcaM_CBB TaxID=2772511 RepID=A0A1L2CUQ8_9CAUD|nr:RNA ligase [Pectobacterium phage vB_PcaM_CBB]AMM43746.1 RNA ligase [Pectobacterium phage vB_PcaM_CBB]
MTELVTEGRKLVTIRKVNAVDPIENADAIEVATVDGWQVVIKKGEFTPTNYCVFFEIDSFLPADNPLFGFLIRNGTKKDEAGVERIRLRSVKLRGQISQGLALPIDIINMDTVNSLADAMNIKESDGVERFFKVLRTLEETRDGIENFLNVTKYERPDERNGGTGAGKAKVAGNFPIVVPKTDEDRIQNVFGKFKQTMQGVPFRKSLKLDGSSQTIAFFNNPDFFVDKVDDEVVQWDEESQELKVIEVKPYPFQWETCQVVVCSRNLALKFDENASFWKAALKDDIPARLKKYCEDHDRQLALQGECIGPGIQGNREQLEEHEFYCFRIWDVDNQNFLDDADFLEVTSILGIKIVPQGEIVNFFDVYDTIKDALNSAEHASMVHPIAEGDVWKSTVKVNGQTIHFKVINNEYLLKSEN